MVGSNAVAPQEQSDENSALQPVREFKQLYSKPIMLLRLPGTILSRKWYSATWGTLRLSDDAINKLPPEVREGTVEARRLIGRKKLAFPAAVSIKGTKLSYKWTPRPSDVIIATAPKTGTTWLQHMVHVIRAQQDTSYDDVGDVIPWIEYAWECGQDLNADQPGGVRAFKSHGLLSRIHEGCKYIITVRQPAEGHTNRAHAPRCAQLRTVAILRSQVREPVKMLKSFFTFVSSKDAAAPLIPPFWIKDVNAFYKCPMYQEGMGGFAGFMGTPMDYYVEYYKCRNLPNVCFIVFEHMLADTKSTIQRVADFIGVELTPTALEKVVELTSAAWMSAPENAAKFDDHMIYSKQVELGRVGFAYNPPVAKVLLKPRSAMVVNDHTTKSMDKTWAKKVAKTIGFKTYEELAASWANELAAKGNKKMEA